MVSCRSHWQSQPGEDSWSRLIAITKGLPIICLALEVILSGLRVVCSEAPDKPGWKWARIYAHIHKDAWIFAKNSRMLRSYFTSVEARNSTPMHECSRLIQRYAKPDARMFTAHTTRLRKLQHKKCWNPEWVICTKFQVLLPKWVWFLASGVSFFTRNYAQGLADVLEWCSTIYQCISLVPSPLSRKSGLVQTVCACA